METATEYDIRAFRGRYPLELLVLFTRDLKDGIEHMDAVGGDAVQAGRGRASITLLRHPDLVRAALVDNNADVTKARGMRLLSLMVGEGLLSSEVPRHTRQRRLVLPAFHHSRLRAYGDVMVRRSVDESGLWREGAPFDLGEAMNRLTLAIAGETLFGADMGDKATRIGDAIALGMEAFDRSQFPFADKLMNLPLPSANQARRSRAQVDEVVYGLLRQRRESGGEHADLLQMLLDARDEDTGEGMTDDEIRDEAVTLLLAGHETTANALAWTWAFLADHPGVEARLHAEVDAFDADPTFDDLRSLPYTRQVLAESMRLRPPAWAIGRQAAHDFSLDGLPIASGATLLIAPLCLHRDPRFWPEPERFDPDRFAPEAKAERHKFAYVPFSFGRRGCIGEPFAWAEGVLVLATLARRWRLRLQGPMPEAHGSVTLRPGSTLKMKPISRGGVTQG